MAGKRSVGELEESEARLRVLFERAPDAYYLSDLKGVLLDGNQAAEELIGYPREELVGKSFLKLDLLPVSELPRAAKLLARNALGHPTGPDEFTLKPKNAPPVVVEIHTIPVTLGGRRTVLGIARDITKRRETESALRRGEERYVRAAEAGKVGVWEWELATDEIYVDPNLKALLGFEDSEIRNHIDDWGARVHPDDVDQVMKAAEAHLSGETERYEVEHRMVHKDGSIRWFLARGTAIRDASGTPLRMVGSDVDITEQKLGDEERRRLEEEASSERSQRLESLGVLAGGIAHDFNNLLTTILGHAGLTLAKLAAEEPARAMVEKIEEAAMAASELTNQLLTYSGKGQLAVRPTDLNRIIEETMSLIDDLVSKNITLRTELAKPLLRVDADDGQLRQVVMNLVINASEAMNGGSGAITIRTETEADPSFDGFVEKPAGSGPFATLAVVDSGEGMSAETRSQIFDPFFTTKFTGRGLGLAAVRGIVRAHHGGIHIETAPGRGTTIRVLFPLSTSEVEVPVAESPRETSTPALDGSVLLVDDEASVRDVVRQMIEDAGVEVITASNGADAVEAFQSHRGRVHVVVLDWMMPDLNGDETLERLRCIEPDLPVVFMSGYDDRAARWTYADNPNVAFVQKPFRQREIVARLSELWPDRGGM